MIEFFKKTLFFLFILGFCFHSTAEDLELRGKGGKISPSKKKPIKVSSKLTNIKKFKETFNEFDLQLENEKLISKINKKNKAKPILLRGGIASNIYKNKKKSIFLIVNPVAFEDPDSKELIQSSTGTGSLISRDGLIITNYHVVENANQVWLYPYTKKFAFEDSEKFLGIVVARDKKVDLAILKVYGLSNKIKPLTFGDIKNIEPGDDVFSMGHPDSLHWSITDGIISSFREDYKIHSVKADMIQNTAPILGGSSGGPLFNAKGELIGINTFGDDSANFNFAVSNKHVIELIDKLPNKLKLNLDKIKPMNEKKLSSKFKDIKPGDYNNNGKIDEWLVDTNNNGIGDTLYVDDNEDGKIEKVYIDKNENQKWDLLVFDDDLDGYPNRQVIDKDEDGKPDLIAYDFNQDGTWDKFQKYKEDNS
ncbi:serine protease [Candidatus Pelagibacter sp.]|jgi:S1-C subfamily serine protease|nr:serine protease [Candidatus Pelagibacter sp.]